METESSPLQLLSVEVVDPPVEILEGPFYDIGVEGFGEVEVDSEKTQPNCNVLDIPIIFICKTIRQGFPEIFVHNDGVMQSVNCLKSQGAKIKHSCHPFGKGEVCHIHLSVYLYLCIYIFLHLYWTSRAGEHDNTCVGCHWNWLITFGKGKLLIRSILGWGVRRYMVLLINFGQFGSLSQRIHPKQLRKSTRKCSIQVGCINLHLLLIKHIRHDVSVNVIPLQHLTQFLMLPHSHSR